MTVVGITMVKDEEDVIGTVLRHMATQVDALVVADNMSTDRTREIIRDVFDSIDTIPMMYLDDFDPAYEQSRKMTGLAHKAHEAYDAKWIVPFDADEIWVTESGCTISEWLAPQQCAVIDAILYDHISTGFDDETEPNPIRRMQWRRTNPGMAKVAGLYLPNMVIEAGNHGIHYLPEQYDTLYHGSGLVVHHFPYRSLDQMVRKIRNGSKALAVTDLPKFSGAHWRRWGDLLEVHGEEPIERIYRKMSWRTNPLSEFGEFKQDPVTL